MIPITFFVFSWSVGTSFEARAADRTPIDPRQPSLVDRREEAPSDLEGVLDAPVFLGALADELLFEPVRELEHLPVPVGEGFLSNDRHETTDVLSFRVRRIELVRDLLVV